jgi:hypothetical protein
MSTHRGRRKGISLEELEEGSRDPMKVLDDAVRIAKHAILSERERKLERIANQRARTEINLAEDQRRRAESAGRDPERARRILNRTCELQNLQDAEERLVQLPHLSHARFRSDLKRQRHKMRSWMRGMRPALSGRRMPKRGRAK